MSESSTLIPSEDRQKVFLGVFKNFDSIAEGAKWIADATESSVTTVMIWRCKGETGYPIPNRPYRMLMKAVAERFTNI